ncbi:MAG: hypothetical protein P8Y58_03965 [Novosphingobium sp.]
MIKQVLLMAVLEEMERQEQKLETLFETRPEDWQEIYTSTRRQIKLCMIEMMGLAQDHLEMNEEDERNLREVAEAFRWRADKHRKRWPVESIDLSDELCVESFRKVRKTSTEFKAVVRALIDRYRADEDKIP